ncbi:MAG: tRNA lysidine(34) synthetase TilS [Nitrospirota bacterium]|jgi:tRNA(Ile)-lysidine synthase
MSLFEKVSDTIRKYSMLSGGETVLVGLSGGPDSVCLITILHALAPGMALGLRAVYVDHGLRPEETPAEIEFAGDLCLRLDVPFGVKQISPRPYAEEQGLSLQDAARNLRYEALEDAAMESAAHRIALGHHLDDQVETFFMHILRGSGPRGLSGIPPVRGRIIRPLIETERRDIEAFLDGEGISYVVDHSNLKHDYLRNRLRGNIMPVLKEVNPGIAETIARTTEILRDEDRYLELQVTKTLMRLVSRKTGGSIELFMTPLEGLDAALLRRVLRRAVDATEGLRAIAFGHIEDIVHLIKAGSAGDRLYLPRDVRVIKKYSTLLLTSELPRKLGAYTISPGEEISLREAGLALSAHMDEEATPGESADVAVLDADRAIPPLTVRSRKEGDYFYPEGFGKKKKLQDFFVDEKVPRDERDAVPIVASGDDIVWVAGMRADDRFVRRKDTKRSLVLELKRHRD